MSTHNICLYGEIKKIISVFSCCLELISYQFVCLSSYLVLFCSHVQQLFGASILPIKYFFMGSNSVKILYLLTCQKSMRFEFFMGIAFQMDQILWGFISQWAMVPILQQILWRNKHNSHIVVVLTFLTWKKKKKDFRLYWGSSKVLFKKISQNFVKSPLKVCLISQNLVHRLWHVCTSLLKRCPL